MAKVHDRGGWPTNEPIDTTEHELSDWERKIDAIVQLLSRKGVIRVDEMRRATEQLPLEQYESLAYYERWTESLQRLMVEKGLISTDEMDRKLAELRARETQA